MQKKNKYMRNNTLPIWIPNTLRKQLFDFMGAGFGGAGRGGRVVRGMILGLDYFHRRQDPVYSFSINTKDE